MMWGTTPQCDAAQIRDEIRQFCTATNLDFEISSLADFPPSVYAEPTTARASDDTFLIERGPLRAILEKNWLRLDAPPPRVSRYQLECFLKDIAGLVLVLRDHIVLHGSAIVWHERAFAIVGPSGVGKSTLTTSLVERGARVWSDDICAFRESDRELNHYRPWVSLGATREKECRFHGGARLRARALAAIFFLEDRSDADVRVDSVEPIAASMRLLEQSRVSHRMIGRSGADHLRRHLDTALAIPCFRVSHAKRWDQMAYLGEALEHQVTALSAPGSGSGAGAAHPGVRGIGAPA